MRCLASAHVASFAAAHIRGALGLYIIHALQGPSSSAKKGVERGFSHNIGLLELPAVPPGSVWVYILAALTCSVPPGTMGSSS